MQSRNLGNIWCRPLSANKPGGPSLTFLLPLASQLLQTLEPFEHLGMERRETAVLRLRLIYSISCTVGTEVNRR